MRANQLAAFPRSKVKARAGALLISQLQPLQDRDFPVLKMTGRRLRHGQFLVAGNPVTPCPEFLRSPTLKFVQADGNALQNLLRHVLVGSRTDGAKYKKAQVRLN